VDEANDDFHLAGSDTNAREKGVDLRSSFQQQGIEDCYWSEVIGSYVMLNPGLQTEYAYFSILLK